MNQNVKVYHVYSYIQDKMTQLQTFQNTCFKVQCVCISGEPWFRGKDVATVLGYANTVKAISNNVDDDDKKKLKELGGHSDYPLDANAQNSLFINESGLYSLILRSEKAVAKTFKKWVTSEVLPQIRKTGSYSTAGHHSSNDISWKEVYEKAAGREDALHYRVVKTFVPLTLMRRPLLVLGSTKQPITSEWIAGFRGILQGNLT